MSEKDFVQKVEGLKKQLYKIAYLYLGNESNALEAVDEAIYKALKSLKKLRQPEYFNTWLIRILINECKKELKRLTKFIVKEDIGQDEVTYDYDALPLREAIAKLPIQLREVIILRYFSGHTLGETAELLDIPQGTVVTRQRRALALLRLELREEDVV